MVYSKLFLFLLWLNFEYWITCHVCLFRCKSATVYFLHNFPTFLWTGISPDFTWFFIDWVSAWFFSDVFSPWPKKKRYLEKSSLKNIPLNAIFASPTSLSEKSNDSYKLVSLEDFSLGAFSGRQFVGFDSWLSFLSFFEILSKTCGSKRYILRKFYIVYFVYHSFFNPSRVAEGLNGPPW